MESCSTVFCFWQGKRMYFCSPQCRPGGKRSADPQTIRQLTGCGIGMEALGSPITGAPSGAADGEGNGDPGQAVVRRGDPNLIVRD